MKHNAGIFVDHRAIESLCINTLNAKQFGVNVYSDPTELFKSILEGHLDVLIVDSHLPSEDVKMIERYRLMSPKLFIIVLGESSASLSDYLAAGSNAVTDAQNIMNAIDAIQIEKTTKQNNSDEVNYKWRLSLSDYHLYCPDNTKIKLTVREFKFLKLLFETDKVVTKDQIKSQVIGGDYFTADQRIALLVARMRKKVNIESGLILPVKSDYTNGYVFAGSKSIKR